MSPSDSMLEVRRYPTEVGPLGHRRARMSVFRSLTQVCSSFLPSVSFLARQPDRRWNGPPPEQIS